MKKYIVKLQIYIKLQKKILSIYYSCLKFFCPTCYFLVAVINQSSKSIFPLSPPPEIYASPSFVPLAFNIYIHTYIYAHTHIYYPLSDMFLIVIINKKKLLHIPDPPTPTSKKKMIFQKSFPPPPPPPPPSHYIKEIIFFLLLFGQGCRYLHIKKSNNAS